MSILATRKLLPRNNTVLMHKTILVVDDDPLYVELVKDVLEMQQHKIVVAYDGKDALSVLTRQRVDLIISDVEMPEMNGIVFHKQLLKTNDYSIPFIFLTSTEDPEKLRYIQEHHPAILLRKSDMIEALLTTISNLNGVKK